MPLSFREGEQPALIVGQDGILRAGWQPAPAGLFTMASGGLTTRRRLPTCPTTSAEFPFARKLSGIGLQPANPCEARTLFPPRSPQTPAAPPAPPVGARIAAPECRPRRTPETGRSAASIASAAKRQAVRSAEHRKTARPPEDKRLRTVTAPPLGALEPVPAPAPAPLGKIASPHTVPPIHAKYIRNPAKHLSHSRRLIHKTNS